MSIIIILICDMHRGLLNIEITIEMRIKIKCINERYGDVLAIVKAKYTVSHIGQILNVLSLPSIQKAGGVKQTDFAMIGNLCIS